MQKKNVYLELLLYTYTIYTYNIIYTYYITNYYIKLLICYRFRPRHHIIHKVVYLCQEHSQPLSGVS